jgi:hypothetical protein
LFCSLYIWKYTWVCFTCVNDMWTLKQFIFAKSSLSINMIVMHYWMLFTLCSRLNIVLNSH